jgi:predicted Rossmann fold nucleotide-binding protein DprA/Smf involved in DNA uptake
MKLKEVSLMSIHRLVGVVGSRSLPVSFAPLVDRVVSLFLSHGYSVASGGAVGADSFALSAVLRQCASARGVVYSAWSSVSGFPAPVRPDIERFIAAGGQVIWGPASPFSSRSVAVPALLGRNRRLVSACSVVVAFIHGPSRGSLYTIRHAVSRGIPVVVFLCGGGASLPDELVSKCRVIHRQEVI